MRKVVATVARHVGDDARVITVRVEVGHHSGAGVDALRRAFDDCTGGTFLAGATLEIVEIPARTRCRTCGADRPVATPARTSACSCGSFDRQLICGGELRLKEVEVF